MRPSEDTRERALAQLRSGYAAGRLETETFSRRVDRALTASCDSELHGLTADLPAPRAGRLARLRARRATGTVLACASGGRMVLGRSSGCQLVFADDTVSRRHAELRMVDGRWILRDLGSANGTWVNGRRVVEVEVAPGDDVQLGCCAFRL
jgi:hypothetical protein